MKKLIAVGLLIYSSSLLAGPKCNINISNFGSSPAPDCRPMYDYYPCPEDKSKTCRSEVTFCPSLENPQPTKTPEAPKQPETPPKPENPPEPPPSPEPSPEPAVPDTPTPQEPEAPPEAPPPEPAGPEPEPSDFHVFQKDEAFGGWIPKKTGKADCSDPAVKCVDKSPTLDVASLLEITLTKGSLGCSQGRCKPVDKLPQQTVSLVDKLKITAMKKGGCSDPNANCTPAGIKEEQIRDECGNLISAIQKKIVIDLKGVLKGTKPNNFDVKLIPVKPVF